MIDAKQEILNTLKPLIKKNEVLNKLNQEDILEIVDHLLENQFNPNEKMTKDFINNIISKLADSYIEYVK